MSPQMIWTGRTTIYVCYFLPPCSVGQDSLTWDADDPEIFHNAPLSIQLVGKAFEDEKLLAIAAEVDSLIHNN